MKRISSPFELLQFEKNRVLNTYDKLVHTKSNFSDPLVSANGGQQVKPLLTWKLSNLNLKQNFYKESDPFMVEGSQWVLFIAKMNDKDCQVGIKYMSPFDDEGASYHQHENFNGYQRYSLLSLLNWVRLDSE